MLVGKRELTEEQRQRARKLVEERRGVARDTLASQSFVDRMTSGSADPDAADIEAEAERRKSENP